jgi:hypothetical protein
MDLTGVVDCGVAARAPVVRLIEVNASSTPA